MATSWARAFAEAMGMSLGAAWRWVVLGGFHGIQPRPDGPVPRLYLRTAGHQRAMALGAMDCSTSAIEQQVASLEVVAAGTVRAARELGVSDHGYLLDEARLCVVRR